MGGDALNSFEYLVKNGKYPMAYDLDALGAQRWELVFAVKDNYDWTLIFKRIRRYER